MKNIVESFYNWYRNTVNNPKYRWFIILGTILYLLSPFDIAPDFIPIMGWIDDGVIVTLLTTELSRLLIEQRRRHQGIANTVDSTTEVEATEVQA